MPKKSLKFIFLTSIIFLLLIISPFVFFDIPKNNHRILGIMLHISYYLLVCAIFLFFEKKLNTKFKALTGSILIPLLIMSLIYITVSMVISPERIFTIDTFDEYVFVIGHYYYQYGLLASIAIILALLIRNKIKT